MEKIKMLIPFNDGRLHEVTCSIDRDGRVLAPNSETILNQNVVFTAPEQDNNAIVNRALHAGYKHVGG